MGRLAVIGPPAAVDGYRLVGALVLVADDDTGVRRAWELLPGDVEVVVLTAEAATLLEDQPVRAGSPLRVVMP